MSRTSGMLTLMMVIGAMPASPSWAQSDGRWCTEVSGAHSQQLISTKSEVSANCDGGLSGSVLNTTPLKTITIRMRPDTATAKVRYVTFAPKNLTVEDTGTQYQGGASALKAEIDDYLAAHKMKASPDVGFIDVVAIKIPSEAKFYEDLSATTPVSAKAPSTLPKFDAGKPLAKEMACMNGLSNVPGRRDVQIAFNAGSATRQPVIIYEGFKRGNKTFDAIYTLDGVVFNEYGANDSYPDEHLYELRGTQRFPDKQFIYTSYSENSWGTPFAMSRIDQDFRPSKKILDSQAPMVDRNDAAMKTLYKQMLQATRQIKDDFDTNPRLKTPENLSLIAEAIEQCQKIEALHPEIEFFKGHVFPTTGDASARSGKALR